MGPVLSLGSYCLTEAQDRETGDTADGGAALMEATPPSLFPPSLGPAGSEVGAGMPSHLSQLTFKEDKTSILALIGRADVTRQTAPEVPNGHGVVVQDAAVPDPPEPAALGRVGV